MPYISIIVAALLVIIVGVMIWAEFKEQVALCGVTVVCNSTLNGG